VASLMIVVSAVLVLSCVQTDRHTDAAKCLTPATVVGVSSLIKLDLKVKINTDKHCAWLNNIRAN